MILYDKLSEIFGFARMRFDYQQRLCVNLHFVLPLVHRLNSFHNIYTSSQSIFYDTSIGDNGDWNNEKGLISILLSKGQSTGLQSQHLLGQVACNFLVRCGNIGNGCVVVFVLGHCYFGSQTIGLFRVIEVAKSNGLV